MFTPTKLNSGFLILFSRELKTLAPLTFKKQNFSFKIWQQCFASIQFNIGNCAFIALHFREHCCHAQIPFFSDVCHHWSLPLPQYNNNIRSEPSVCKLCLLVNIAWKMISCLPISMWFWGGEKMLIELFQKHHTTKSLYNFLILPLLPS